MDALEEVGNILLTSEIDQLSALTKNSAQFSVYFSKELNRLKHIDSLGAEKILQLLKALLYTESLIKICTIKEKKLYRDVVKNHLPPIIPESVIESIRGQFTCQEGPSWCVFI